MVGADSLLGVKLGTCRLERLIGQGGMGAVFLAQQERPHRQVAVKVLLPSLLLDSTRHRVFLARFRREADAVAALDHANILPLFEYGEQEGLAYLVMPYVSGGTLRDQIVLIRQGQSLPLFQVASYLDQAAAALEYAHQHGVIHRDVKPANFLLHPDGRLLLSDFGIARLSHPEPGLQFSGGLGFSDASSDATSLTQTGVMMGTPAYIAPEQLRGGKLDGRADLYSLGAMVYELLTGAAPFSGETSILLVAKHLSDPPPPLLPLRPDLPEEAEQVVLRALEKAPEDRFQHVSEFAGAFRAALEAAGLAESKQHRPSFASGGLLGNATKSQGSRSGSVAPGSAHTPFLANTPGEVGRVTPTLTASTPSSLPREEQPPLPPATPSPAETPDDVELAPTVFLAQNQINASGAALEASAASRSDAPAHPEPSQSAEMQGQPALGHIPGAEEPARPPSWLEAQETRVLPPAHPGQAASGAQRENTGKRVALATAMRNSPGLKLPAEDHVHWTAALIAGLALGLASILTTVLYARDLWVWWALFAVIILLTALKQRQGSRNAATGEAVLVALLGFGAGFLVTLFSGSGRQIGEGVLLRLFLVIMALLLAVVAAWLARLCFFPAAGPPSMLRLVGSALLFGTLALVVVLLLAWGNALFALRQDASFDTRFQRALLYFLAHLLIAPGAYLRVLEPQPFIEFVGWALAVTLMGIAVGAAVIIARDLRGRSAGSISRAVVATGLMQFSYLAVGLVGLYSLEDDPKLLRALQATPTVSLAGTALPIVALLPLVALFFSILGVLWFQRPAKE